jgi:hypothetical protein
MTPEELKPHMAELAGVLSDATGELERLLPDLVGYPDLDVVRVSKGPELGGVIYALTTIGDPNRTGPGPMRCRTVGYFWALEQAEEVLTEDYGDLDEEMFYPWAVIEEVCPGVYPNVRSQRFWEYDRQVEGWKKADGCPASLQEHMRPDSRGVRIVSNWSQIG